MQWWFWIMLAIFLAVGELCTPGVLLFLFFAIGALLVGLFTYWEWIQESWVQWLTFSGLAIVSSILFALKRKVGYRKSLDDADQIEGQYALIKAIIKPGHKGQVELRGSTWQAINKGLETLEKGSSALVVGRKGNTLELANAETTPSQ